MFFFFYSTLIFFLGVGSDFHFYIASPGIDHRLVKGVNFTLRNSSNPSESK